jgi:hypothetical protein
MYPELVLCAIPGQLFSEEARGPGGAAAIAGARAVPATRASAAAASMNLFIFVSIDVELGDPSPTMSDHSDADHLSRGNDASNALTLSADA